MVRLPHIYAVAISGFSSIFNDSSVHLELACHSLPASLARPEPSLVILISWASIPSELIPLAPIGVNLSGTHISGAHISGAYISGHI
jgi:hypothetical protein